MNLYGWKYEGRKISDQLHEQILQIVSIINSPEKVAGRKWPELQRFISKELNIAPGQVRTIKRMMEEFDIVAKSSLNANDVPSSNIFTSNGKLLIELLETEKVIVENPNENIELLKEIKAINQLYYQKILVRYYIEDEDKVLHPLRATLKALLKYQTLDYWEWYLLNTIIRSDDDKEQESLLDLKIKQYRNGHLTFTDSNILSNKLSHSYVLGNFEYTGLISVEGKKPNIKIEINKQYMSTILEIAR